jgi:hypothetical protein
MDKQTATAIRKWIKATRKEVSGDRSDWARGFKRACDEFGLVIDRAEAGDLAAIKAWSEA